jgi:hypothetical protein
LKHACKIWQIFLNFHQQVAIATLQKHLILALFIFILGFLAIHSQLKKRAAPPPLEAFHFALHWGEGREGFH